MTAVVKLRALAEQRRVGSHSGIYGLPPICCQSAWLSQARPFPRNCSPAGSQQGLSSLGYKDTDVSVTRVVGAIAIWVPRRPVSEGRHEGTWGLLLGFTSFCRDCLYCHYFLDPLHPSSPRSDGAASCCCSPDAASCGALGFPFGWKRPVCNEHRHGILPCWVRKWPHL